ncbi:Major facilitator superfamily domain general substrate transporter [Penicillium cf. griseofulvum]|uniref:Major facilitator superfamily domain general substrate transporter n=1 Tax=Penicillium cf. griseofulvum TaxID=2972120 RepID=A0A9W9IW23_9EURO|nr:Major facilitator superfamily domain general substrate transporter [Penicillium cf. griseofulvum]
MPGFETAHCMATKTDAMEKEPPMEAFKLLPNNTNSNWIKDRGLRKLNMAIMFMFSTASSAGYIGNLVNSLLVLPEFDEIIGGLNPSIVGVIIAATSVGALVSFAPASYIADKFGRKTCVCIGSSIVVVGAIISTMIKSHWAFFGTRVLSGIGMGITQTAAPLLATEIAHPRQRQTATALYNGCWSLGAIGSAAVTYATIGIANSWSWRLPCLLQISYPLFQILGLVMFVPESPRWLVSKGRKDEALAILGKYHANGDAEDELVQYEYRLICTTITAEITDTRSWSSFFSSRGDMHRLAICVLVGFMQEWAGNGILIPPPKEDTVTNSIVGLLSYYLAPILISVGITKATDQAAVNISLNAWNFLLAGAGALASERYGRRILWLISTVAMIVFLSMSTLAAGLFAERHLSAAGLAVVSLLFLFFGAYDIAYAPLFLSYPAEILPFQLRAKGIAVTLSADAVACFFNQYVNPVAFTAIAWKYYCVFLGSLVMFLVLIYFLFPETKGRSLEEVAMIFDKENESEIDSQKKTDKINQN